jgi:cAMP-dependent protein kinase regulator
MRDGDYFGLMSLVLNEKCTATTMARAFTDLLVLSADDFERIKADYPELRDALSRASSQQTGHLSQLLLEGVVL